MIELFQIVANLKYYFTSLGNILDFVGIMSITAYLVYKFVREKDDNELINNILILGIFCKMYRGIVSLSIIHPELMKGVKLLKNTIKDMGNF